MSAAHAAAAAAEGVTAYDAWALFTPLLHARVFHDAQAFVSFAMQTDRSHARDVVVLPDGSISLRCIHDRMLVAAVERALLVLQNGFVPFNRSLPMLAPTAALRLISVLGNVLQAEISMRRESSTVLARLLALKTSVDQMSIVLRKIVLNAGSHSGNNSHSHGSSSGSALDVQSLADVCGRVQRECRINDKAETLALAVAALVLKYRMKLRPLLAAQDDWDQLGQLESAWKVDLAGARGLRVGRLFLEFLGRLAGGQTPGLAPFLLYNDAHARPPCLFGGACPQLDDALHASERLHVCPAQPRCPLDDPHAHAQLYFHDDHWLRVCKDDGHCVAFYRGTCPAEHVIQTCFPALPCNYIALCGDDTCTRRHLCPKGIACELVHHDVVHVQRELHICASGPGCAVTDPRHRLEYLHPCLTQSKVCVQSGDELHRSTSLHKCKFGRGCRFANRWLEAAGKGEGLSPGDADHVRRFVHVCPLPAGTCTDETLLHRLQFQHVCPNGAACTKLQTASDLAHLMFMVHEAQSSDPVRAWSCTNEPSAATVLVIGGAPASSSPFHGGSAVAAEPVLPPHVAKLFARLTAHDVDMLTPVVSDVLWGARQPVLVQGRPGELLGVCAKLPGQCLVEFVSDTGARERIVVADASVVNIAVRGLIMQPWARVPAVYRPSPAVQQAFHDLLNTVVHGLAPPVTFAKVFAHLHQQGVPCFIIGGAVRDLVCAACDGGNLGKAASAIKDIDMSFGCLAQLLEKIATAAGWKVRVVAQTARVVLGDTVAGKLNLEGKPMVGHNSDANARGNEATTYSSDLTRDPLVRDFSCNSLLFDPINCVIVDPSGFGVGDCSSKTLRIAVPPREWPAWIAGNLTKIFRFWKMLTLGWTCDKVMLDYIVHHVKRALSAGTLTAAAWRLFRSHMDSAKADALFAQMARDVGDDALMAKLKS